MHHASAGKKSDMCRLLGYAAPTATTTSSVLGADESAVFQDMARLHRDGWGSSWLTSGVGSALADEHSASPHVGRGIPDPTSTRSGTLRLAGHAAPPSLVNGSLVNGSLFNGSPYNGSPVTGHQVGTRRSAASGLGDIALTRALRSDTAQARILHLRMATDGMIQAAENTHPFSGAGLSFAHNGSLTPAEGIERHISPTLRDSLTGTTDSERYFAAIRTRIDAGVPVVEAVRATVAALRSDFPDASLNALLLTPSHLISIHASENARIPHREFDASGIGDEHFPRHHRDAYYLMRSKRLTDGTVVFASSGLDIAGWEPLPAESIAAVDLSTLELTVTPVFGAHANLRAA